MKTQIEEVQRYFIDKITSCNFDKYEIKDRERWTHFDVKIDGYSFSFGINKTISLFCFFSGLIIINVPNDRLNNLYEFIDKEYARTKAEKINQLQKELNQLQNS